MLSYREDALDLSARVTDPVAKIAWLEVVKDGWIKVAGMMAQLHFDYDWIFDHVYVSCDARLNGNNGVTCKEIGSITLIFSPRVI